jgi:hypothetical protein
MEQPDRNKEHKTRLAKKIILDMLHTLKDLEWESTGVIVSSGGDPKKSVDLPGPVVTALWRRLIDVLIKEGKLL